jgi:hypothetical protein
MTTGWCDRTAKCLNFRLKERPTCNECDVLVTMNHFHNTHQNYRICHDCFEINLEAIQANSYIPKTLIVDERRICENYERCFAEAPYGIFKTKLCDVCGQLYPPEHYHDIHKNIRLCLNCYVAKRAEYNEVRA